MMLAGGGMEEGEVVQGLSEDSLNKQTPPPNLGEFYCSIVVVVVNFFIFFCEEGSDASGRLCGHDAVCSEKKFLLVFHLDIINA